MPEVTSVRLDKIKSWCWLGKAKTRPRVLSISRLCSQSSTKWYQATISLCYSRSNRRWTLRAAASKHYPEWQGNRWTLSGNSRSNNSSTEILNSEAGALRSWHKYSASRWSPSQQTIVSYRLNLRWGLCRLISWSNLPRNRMRCFSRGANRFRPRKESGRSHSSPDLFEKCLCKLTRISRPSMLAILTRSAETMRTWSKWYLRRKRVSFRTTESTSMTSSTSSKKIWVSFRPLKSLRVTSSHTLRTSMRSWFVKWITLWASDQTWPASTSTSSRRRIFRSSIRRSWMKQDRVTSSFNSSTNHFRRSSTIMGRAPTTQTLTTNFRITLKNSSTFNRALTAIRTKVSFSKRLNSRSIRSTFRGVLLNSSSKGRISSTMRTWRIKMVPNSSNSSSTAVDNSVTTDRSQLAQGRSLFL